MDLDTTAMHDSNVDALPQSAPSPPPAAEVPPISNAAQQRDTPEGPSVTVKPEMSEVPKSQESPAMDVLKEEPRDSENPIPPPNPYLPTTDLDAATARAIAEAQNTFNTRVRPKPDTEPRSASPMPLVKNPSGPKKRGPKRNPANRKPTAKRRKLTAPDDRSTPAASSPSRASSEEVDTDDDEVYCICRKGDNHTWMICCEECNEWYHGRCISIREEDEKLMDKFACPRCEDAGKSYTTWLPLCRRTACGKAARVRSSTGKPLPTPSKYCSDECGAAFMREMLARRAATPVRRAAADAEGEQGSIGGAITLPELKALVTGVRGAEDFRHLGISGLPTPPASASPERETLGDAPVDGPDGDRLREIAALKQLLRTRRTLLKDRERFVQLAKERAVRRAAEKDTKDHCGFDVRLSWDDVAFARWRGSAPGRAAFERGVLVDDAETDPDGMDVDGDEEARPVQLCAKKARSCARHPHWQRLALQDVRFEEADVGDEMRRVDREERDIRERARRAAGEGRVEGVGEDGTVEVLF